MQHARKTVLWPVSLLACALVAAGCQLLVNLDGLEDRSCPLGKKPCNDECVSESNPATGCNNPTCAPCAPPHANAICDGNNHCSFVQCIDPWYDCNGFEDDGCETDVAHDPEHCGKCSKACDDPPHGIAGCSEKRCVIGKCDDGWEDCDRERDGPTGCEHQIWTDLECVACGVPCPAGTSCNAGVCR